MKTDIFDVWIPSLPPGINRQYGRARNGHVYLKPAARVWKQYASIIVGARAGAIDWQDCGGLFNFEMYIVGSRSDADAYVKTVLDTVTEKLGFDDSRVISQRSTKCSISVVRDMYKSYEAERRNNRKVSCLSLIWEIEDYCTKSGIYVILYPAEG